MTVLVTGGTGFVAGWCIAQLLERGYDVRTTVRTAAGPGSPRRSPPRSSPATGCVVAVADLRPTTAGTPRCEGCAHVLHVASPMGGRHPEDPDDLIVPARDGTLRVLRGRGRWRADGS